MKIKGNIDMLGDEDGVKITVYDKAAVTVICDIHLTPEQFCAAALGRLSSLECDIEVPAPERIGKERETMEHEFRMPTKEQWQNRFGSTNRVEVAKAFVKSNHPYGWTPNLYFGSKSSFFWRDIDGTNENELWARTTLMRWVYPNHLVEADV